MRRQETLAWIARPIGSSGVVVIACLSLGSTQWGCSGGNEAAIESAAQESVGLCVREPEVLSGPEVLCVTDIECPCGSFCDTAAGVCTYSCMPPGQAPPDPGPGALDAGAVFTGDPSPCAAGSACDDTGRCIGVAGLPGTAVVLGADPPTLTTMAGGPSKPFEVRLRLTDPSPAELAASQATIVRVLARDGAEVSCDGATYSDECELTSWTFAFDGAFLQATKVARVRTVSGTEDGHGDVLLAIDTTGERLIVPTAATTPLVDEDGIYAGAAFSSAYPGGIRVTARVRQHQILVREPSRTIAPDGALLLDVRTSGTPGPRRRAVWLREAGAPDTAGAIVGDYGAGIATVDLEARTIEVPVSFNVPGTVGLDEWAVQLTRTADHEPECATTADCGTGQVCAASLQACVPSAVWTPTTTPIGNVLDDQRSAAWWTSVVSRLQAPPFATTGADVVEALLCSVGETSTGRLGVSQIKRGSSASRSGDLACLDSAGAPNGSSGAVGLATIYDRAPVDSQDSLRLTPALLQACLTDLARTPPVNGSFAQYFGPTVGPCANLARFVPAMRLLATDALNKSTLADLEPRARGLLVRLTQQWAMLHGLIASAGLSQRDYDDVLNPTATAAARRTALLGVLDTLDRGWSALLDQRIAPAIRNAVRWSPAAENDLSRDYRLLKQPVVYWTFNGATPTNDVVNDAALVPQGPFTPTQWDCPILPAPYTLDNFRQGFNCPGYQAALPPEVPSLVDDASLGGAGRVDDLTVTINVDGRDFGDEVPTAVPGSPGAQHCPPDGCEPPPDPEPDPDPPPRPQPPYRGGTLIATPTLAVAESVTLTSGQWVRTLVVAHPTATGVELTTFGGYGTLGQIDDEDSYPVGQGTTIAIVRDAQRKRYTLYVWRPTGLLQVPKSYIDDPAGTLDWVPARTIRVGAASNLPAGHHWTPYKKSYPGHLDDVAVFDSALSAGQVERFASARGIAATLRTVWPEDMVLAVQGTHEIVVPLGAQLLETQVAELEVAGRLMAAVQDRAQVACESNQVTAAAARAEVDAVVARVGRTLRQSHLVEGFAEPDTSDRAVAARHLLEAKRRELSRALEPARCTPPFEMADDEVPIYHDSIDPNASETHAYFAASDHLLGLAEQRASAAQAALADARNAYDLRRQSQIQELQTTEARNIRIEAITSQYGDGLRRLCGIAGQTNAEIVDAIVDPDPDDPFSVDTCYIEPTAACLEPQDSLADVDPACYRGQIGENLMSLRAAYFAQLAAHQSWQTAIDNAQAAERFCIWKEMDLFGCSAADRYDLTGVECPACDPENDPDSCGTLELVEAFNDELDKAQRSKANWQFLMNGLHGAMAAGVSKWPGPKPEEAQVIPVIVVVAVAVAVFKGICDWWFANQEVSIEERRRAHEEVLARRAARAEIAACWNEAGQYERAIQAAELSAKQALGQLEAGAIGFDNALGEANQIVLEVPVAMERELNRPTIPIAFHYWLDEKIATYESLLESARRYTYVALRATEYDMQASYKTPVLGKPLRSAVLAASHPQQLISELLRMRDQTNGRLVNGRRPSLGHLTFDVGEWLWGLSVGSPVVGRYLSAYLRDVYDTAGEYQGKGIRFSFVPRSDTEAPISRCAERIWRVAVGAVGFPTNNPNYMHSKLIKRNVFASRMCGADGLQSAIWRPESNLLVGGGDAATFEPQDTDTTADTALVRLDVDGALENFRNSGQAYNLSSTELSLQGLYGDYVLLFPAAALAPPTGARLVPESLLDINIRFDFVSVDDSPSIPLQSDPQDLEAQVELRLDSDTAPIVIQ